MKILKIECWEVDEDLHPTGKEKTLKAKSIRRAIKHLSYELGAKLDSTGCSVIMSDGKRWFGRRI